ncbi:YqaA family protein [Psychromonas sp. 14N.309.X.WAT.B.A12]|uniref:YqaA family protein n=1 Tax=unclassified Psychromonas TaxID=2614957 RepID=UPI0025AFA4F8|nr:YqaA family protein [Psychromonas sp. 14N.309.X.WAT.B.A12]MDN2663840.1 DedA family protein [Psychromonas sp. 14N.309.X.WAT.B.A12]
MKIFAPLYEKVMLWSKHKHAPFYLYVTAFIESIFWPIPVDIMLAPMALAKREKAWQFAFGATLFSVLGGALGYYLGSALYDPVVLPFIEAMHYQDKMITAQSWFSEWGVLVIFIASFTPIPFKVFTVTAGVMSMAFWPFMLTALIGRAMRFFLVAGLMVLGGEKMETKLSKYIDVLGWITILAAVILYFTIKH